MFIFKLDFTQLYTLRLSWRGSLRRTQRQIKPGKAHLAIVAQRILHLFGQRRSRLRVRASARVRRVFFVAGATVAAE